MSLIARVTGLLTKPAEEWRAVAAEPVNAGLWRYVAIVAAVPVVSSFIGSSLVGVQVPTVGTVRIGIAAGLAQALIGYVLAFISVYLTALAIDALATVFRGRKISATR